VKGLNIMKVVRVVVHVASVPAHRAYDYVHNHIPQSVKERWTVHHGRAACGSVMMLVGSIMATNTPAWLPHFLWDAVAYGLHGFGSAPVFKLVCIKLHIDWV
jgi:hypothetical protein